MIGYSLPRLRGTARPACRRRSCGSCWRRRWRSGRAAPPSGGRRGRRARAGLRRGRGARRRCPGRVSSSALSAWATLPRVVEIVAADLERQAAAAVVAAREQAVQLLVAARRRSRGRSTPGRPDSCRRRSWAIWSLERVRSSFGVSRMLHVAAVHGCRRRPKPPPPPPALDDDRRSLRARAALTICLEPQQHRLGELDARAQRAARRSR